MAPNACLVLAILNNKFAREEASARATELVRVKGAASASKALLARTVRNAPKLIFLLELFPVQKLSYPKNVNDVIALVLPVIPPDQRAV